MSDAVTVLAFDVGLKRTGVAVGQSLTGTTQVAGQIPVKQGRLDWTEVTKLMEHWQPDQILIGDPQSDNPHLNKVINRLKSFVRQNYKLPVVNWNEAYTTESANVELQALNQSTSDKRALRDQLAACLMLEAYFDSL